MHRPRFKICTRLAALLVCFATLPAAAQLTDNQDLPPTSVRYGEPDVIRYRVGAEITAKSGGCRDLLAMVAVPFDCPEQQVRIIEEEISSEVDQVGYRLLQGGARQMLISVPQLPSGATARAVVTFEVTTRPILPPEETDSLVIPRRVPRELRAYVGGSPYIETNHRSISSLAREIFRDLENRPADDSTLDDSATEDETLADDDRTIDEDAATAEPITDWQRVEAIYDYVLENIVYFEGPDKSALNTLRDGQADCQGRSALFIALCRANDVPARMVWVDGHAYPEFYLETPEGQGCWYPCESAGTRAFGEMPLARTVLQKGDNFRVPERPKDRLRYASDYLIGLPMPGGGRPRVRYIREPIFTNNGQPWSTSAN